MYIVYIFKISRKEGWLHLEVPACKGDWGGQRCACDITMSWRHVCDIVTLGGARGGAEYGSCGAQWLAALPLPSLGATTSGRLLQPSFSSTAGGGGEEDEGEGASTLLGQNIGRLGTQELPSLAALMVQVLMQGLFSTDPIICYSLGAH